MGIKGVETPWMKGLKVQENVDQKDASSKKLCV